MGSNLGYTKFDFTVDEGKGRLNPSRDKKLRQAPQKEGGEKQTNSCVALLLCDPGWCVHILTERCSLTFRINEMTTNKQLCYPPPVTSCLIRNSTGNFREASRGSTALTGITQVGVAVDVVIH